MSYKLMVFRSSVTVGEEGIDSKGISVQNVISRFLILILLFVSYSLISFNFFYFIFLERPRSPWEVHAEPLGLRGAQVGNL